MCLEKLLSNNDCIWEEILTEPLKLKSYYKKNSVERNEDFI